MSFALMVSSRPANDVGGAPGHRHGRSIGIAGGNLRHDGRVHDTQTFDAAHAQFGIDHGALVASHAATADGVIATAATAVVRGDHFVFAAAVRAGRSEEHTSELQSLMRISYAVFCLKKKNQKHIKPSTNTHFTDHD